MALKTEFRVEVHLEGLAAWGQAVEAAVEAAVDAEGQATLEDAQQRAPVSDAGSHGNPAGFMRDSTTWTLDTPLSGTLEAAAPYSGFTDQGTRLQAAQPWFTPAIEHSEQRFPNRLAEAIRKAGGEVAG